MLHHAHRLTSWFIPRSATLAAVALAAAFFVAALVPAAHAQQPGNRPDFKVTAATFDGKNLHVEYINATGIGYPARRYEVGFQWYDSQGQPLGARHWLPVPEVERGGVSILDNRSRIELSYRSGRNTYGRRLARFIEERPNTAAELRVTVDDGDRIAEENERNNVAVLAVAPVAPTPKPEEPKKEEPKPSPPPPPKLPDLTMTDATLDTAALRFWYHNRGEGAATPGVSLWYEWVDAKDERVGELRWVDVDAMSAGSKRQGNQLLDFATLDSERGKVTLGDFVNGAPPSATHLKLAIDGPNAHAESNEQNNVVLLPRPVAPKPDLTFTNIFLVPPSRERLVIGFENRGKVAAPEFPWVMAWVDAAGKRVGVPYEGMGLALKATWRFGASSDMSDPKGKPMPIGKWLAQQKPDGATKLEIVIDLDNRIAESDEENNRQTFDEWVPPKPVEPEKPAQADLMLRDATLAGGKFRATIVNIGTAPATRIMWQFAWVGSRGDALNTSDVEAAVGTLAPGAAYPVELPIANARAFGIFQFLQDMPDAAAALTITVDPKNAIAESDETNNVTRVEIVGPDLTLGAIDARDGVLAIEVKNTGSQPSVATDIWLMWFGAKGALSSSGAVDLPAIAAGGATTVSVSLDGTTEASKILRDPPKDGTRLSIFLDGSRRVEERSERNNDRMINREKLLKPAAPTVAKLPDLVVRDLVITPERPQRNTVVTFTARVENVGNASVGRLTATWLDLIRPRDGAMALPREKPTTPDLAPGASVVVRWDGEKFWTVQDGEHLVIICAESMGHVYESDEDNNCARKKFIVVPAVPVKPAQPDLVVQKVAFTPTNPEAGDVLTVTAVVHNAGTARAGASVAWFTPNADSDDDEASAIPTPHDIPALAPGLSATVTWEEAWVAETGTEAFEVCADVEEAVAESNEGNNCRTAKLTVSDVSFLRRAVGFPLRVVLDVFSTPIRAGTAE